MTVPFLVLVVVLAGTFAFVNGFRDASIAVALSVRTRALTPSVAVVLAALFNFVGAVLSGGFALATSMDWIILPSGPSGLAILASGLLSAILWGVYAWWRGIPLSSTHALVGGIAGAATAGVATGTGSIQGADESVLTQIVLPLVLSPVLAFLAAYLLIWPVTWAARYAQPNVINSRFRRAQAVSTAAVAFGHGIQDGQRTAAVLILAMLAAGVTPSHELPPWVLIVAASFLTLGTLFGGWRIAYTLGYKLIRVDPLRGFVVQALTSVMLFVGAITLHWPLSTTHTLTSATLGAGANQKISTTHRRLALRIFKFWLLTPAVTAFVAFIFALACSPLTR
ncbi:inorganic phosphate transporter [Arthrobacter sp. M4]|uniref:inorganic phosphate transporter n=1 Tax=Arthrobacter sp. M4 TaxID=218160 RepID=UPI001CDD89D2|nr:inorganic phosphate transporter [Arthrobacter sp. M4]MCA4134518.1 inorganic phosphate transporter [Arthrobacter sp. M4]